MDRLGNASDKLAGCKATAVWRGRAFLRKVESNISAEIEVVLGLNRGQVRPSPNDGSRL